MPSSLTFSELREREQNLKNLLDQARRLSAGRGGTRAIEDFRARDTARKQTALEAKKALWIPEPEDRARREQLEALPFEWLAWYFPDIFREPFQDHHQEMVLSIERATVYGGYQAIAGPRGEGKTTLAECCTIRNVLRGIVDFSVLFASTAYHATNSLASIKEYITRSDRLLADYPEVCIPIRDAEGSPNRAHSAIVHGKDFSLTNAHFQWSGEEVTMPRVPGSACSGFIIATRGLDAAVLGLKKGVRRPKLAIIDDPDTESTSASEEQAKKLESRIERGIALLAPKGSQMSMVMLTTTHTPTCVSVLFTDPQIKPAWKGKRYAFVKAFPERVDMWEEYTTLRQKGQREGDAFGRTAHNFYLERRQQMDAGAVVANPSSFDHRILADGSQSQVSALQRYYDYVSDNGEAAALCQLQNQPPPDAGRIESGISSHRIQTQVSGFPRKEIPPGCSIITQGVDVRKVALHWVVRAWLTDDANRLVTGYTIDYGVQDVWGTTAGSDEGLDDAVKRALMARKDALERAPYKDHAGNPHKINLTLVDAGWRTEAIYEACRDLGLDWKPSMGFGKSNGCVHTSFTGPIHNTPDKKMGDRWFLSKKPKGTWLVCMDADFWKAWEHDRWMSDPNKAGTMLLFGEKSDRPDRMSQDEKGHFAYSKHLTAEIEVEEVVKGVLKRYWKAKSDSNHYLDASYMSDVAATMMGVQLVGKPAATAAMTVTDWLAARSRAAR